MCLRSAGYLTYLHLFLPSISQAVSQSVLQIYRFGHTSLPRIIRLIGINRKLYTAAAFGIAKTPLLLLIIIIIGIVSRTVAMAPTARVCLFLLILSFSRHCYYPLNLAPLTFVVGVGVGVFIVFFLCTQFVSLSVCQSVSLSVNLSVTLSVYLESLRSSILTSRYLTLLPLLRPMHEMQ